VRFHHGVSSSGAVTVEPSRSCPLDSSVVKNKETAVRSDVIDRVPVVTPNGGVKPSSVILPTQLAEKGIEQPVVSEKVVEAAKDDLTSQMFFVEDGPCKRGRPLKRQMNLVFQEKVLTDAEMALQKEAEASRKALEMLQQEMSTGDETPGTSMAQSVECVQQKMVSVKQPLSKGQTSQSLNNILTTAPRILPKEPLTSTKLVAAKTNIVTQVTSVNTPETSSQNVIYQVAGNTISAIDSGSNETNIVYQLQEGVIAGQDSSTATNIVYQVADNAVVSGQDSNSQNIIYQVADNTGTSAEGNNNTNIIYQVADNSNAGSASAMSQYMEVLKEAGLPSDVPILLESSDGSYVTVNEEVLMNIMNGGMIQVGDGSIVGGEGVQFIVQEVQEVTEGQVETPMAPAEQSVSTEMNVTDNVLADEQVQMKEASDSTVESKPAVTETDTNTVKPSTHRPFNEEVTKPSSKDLPSLQEKEPMDVELAASQNENTVAVTCSGNSVQYEVNQLVMEEGGVATDRTSMEIDDNGVIPQSATEPPSHSDEIITGDGYGEEAMEGFAVMETKENMQRRRVHYTRSGAADFIFPEQTCSNEVEDKSFPSSVSGMGDGGKVAEIPANGGMSVEQALQAMMGEGSDTEMEVCANTDADGITKVRPIISHRDTKGRSTPNEGSIDEETEDLRLVLSPEDDSIKVEDESQSAGEGSLNDSFTLALSSPDSTGNDKAHLEAENLAESVEGNQQVEMKSVESENDTQAKISQDRIAQIKYPCESTLTSVPKSSDSLGVEDTPSEAVKVGTSKTVENNGSEADEPTVQTVTNESRTEPMETNNSVPTHCNSDVSETESPAAASKSVSFDKTEGHSESDNTSAVKSDGGNKTTEVLISELNLTYSIVENDKVSSNEPGSEVLPENDNPSDTGFSSNIDNITSTEVALAGAEATVCSPSSESTMCNPTSSVASGCTSTESSVNVSTRDVNEVGKSLPIISLTDPNTGDEGEESAVKADSLHELVGSSRSAASVGAGVLESEMKNDADTKLPAAEILGSIVPDTAQQGATRNDLTDEQGKEAQETELSKEATEIGLNSEKETDVKGNSEVAHCESGQGNKAEEGGKMDSESDDRKDMMLVENQENTEFISPSINTDKNGLQTSVDKGEGAVSSPSKDIPYAVGLLPLKTALEKLQAMPEYHPRKTRSASSGKESGSEVPASRLKRKASSSADSLEKKMKPSDADDGDGSYDSEGAVAMAAEDFDETGDGDTVLETYIAEDSSKPVLKSPEETVTVDNKMEPLPSMMELVSDSVDAV
jgi:hypothetical protein